MYKNKAAAPIVATVIEKMLSTALYWNTDRSGIAAPNKQKPWIIASPLVDVVLKKMPPPYCLGNNHPFNRQAITATIGRVIPPGKALSDSPRSRHIVYGERFFGKRIRADERCVLRGDDAATASRPFFLQDRSAR
jgi:hypothetical protein